MKISKVIEKLNSIKEKEGGIKVLIINNFKGFITEQKSSYNGFKVFVTESF